MRTQTLETERRSILYTVAERLAECPEWPGGKTDPARNAIGEGERMSKDTILLTTAQAAKVVGLQPSTLETYRTRGGGPRFRKIGRWVRYVPADLEAWLEECGRDSTSDNGSNARGKRRKRKQRRRGK